MASDVRTTGAAAFVETRVVARFGEIALFLASSALVVYVNRWAVHGSMFFFGDEFGNLGRIYWHSYAEIFNVLPQWVYNDRPVGFLLIRALYDVFGFNFLPQIAIMILLHFVNFLLVFLVARKLFESDLYALIAATLFGANASTITSAWYLGTVFDVICTGFLLGSLLAYLYGSWWRCLVSPLLFFFALRSKEFAVVFPLLLVLLEWRAQAFRVDRNSLGIVLRRTAPHLLVLGIVLAVYASWLREYLAITATQTNYPYLVSLAPDDMLRALNYYVAVVGYTDGVSPASTRQIYWLLVPALVLIGLAFRRFWVLFGVTGFIALLLPVLVLPRQATEFYVYGPSVFLSIGVADLIRLVADTVKTRLNIAAGLTGFAVYAAVVSGLLVLFNTPYTSAKIDWYRTSRQMMFRDAQPVLDRELRFGPGAHYYVAGLQPYMNVFSSGPCYFLQIYYRDPDIRCFVEMPTEQLTSLFASDTAERYFFDYANGKLTLRASAPANPGARPAPAL
jgi:hypothetical protein